MAETNVTFKSACNTALSMEMASCNTLEFSGKIKESATVNKVYNQSKKRDDQRKSRDTNYCNWQKGSVDDKRNSYVSPATDVVVSIQLLCADLNKKNVTIAQKWDILHACVGIRRHCIRPIMSNRRLERARQMRIMRV